MEEGITGAEAGNGQSSTTDAGIEEVGEKRRIENSEGSVNEASEDQPEKKARTEEAEPSTAEEQTTSSVKEEEDEGAGAGAGKTVQKRMMAVQLGYVGTKYSGLQKNPGQHTIELELEKAVHAAGLIHDANFGHQQKLHWSRAARTDKGVHALGNVVALKLLIGPSQTGQEIADSINTHLPEDVRVFDVKRGTKSFNAKLSASGRIYHYLLPTFALQPTEPPAVPEKVEGAGAAADDAKEGAGEEEQGEPGRKPQGWKKENFWENSAYQPSPEEIAAARAYRAPADLVERLNQVLRQMKGTHAFHNYTSGKSAQEANAKRFIVSFAATEVREYGGVEFVELQVEGQSFMIHQIRKMVGVAVLILRFGRSPSASLQTSFRHKKVHIPTAPATGLLLGKVLFKSYNQQNKHLPPLDFLDLDEPMRAFKQQRVYPEIVRREVEDHCTLRWLDELHTFYATWL